MGFKNVYVAQNSLGKNVKFDNINVLECKTLQEVIKHVFSIK